MRLLQDLQNLGPAGLVDKEADEIIRVFSDTERGRSVGESADAGRKRFHQLQAAALDKMYI